MGLNSSGVQISILLSWRELNDWFEMVYFYSVLLFADPKYWACVMTHNLNGKLGGRSLIIVHNIA